jgi:hypothetical protein
MSQPCIKFISHTTSYIAFITMIIVSSVQFSFDQNTRCNFSQIISPSAYNTYRKYASNGNVTYTFDFEDFFVRRSHPEALDLAITIWVAGEEYK